MRKVLITGASRGIGAETARYFAKMGDKVYINYNKSEKEAKELAEEIGGVIVKADVSNSAEVKEMFRKIGDIDVLINNAGVAGFYMMDAMTDEEWDRIISVNLSGAFYCTREALKSMISKKKGAIVNVSSIWGETGGACEVAYSASKAGLIGMTKALSKEVGPSGIRVNCIAPGTIDTDMNKNLDKDAIEMICEETPLGRVGKAEEVAKAIYFLADEEGYITGQVLGISGGFVV